MAKRLTTEEFVRRSMKLYGNKFDYSKVEYKGLNTKVCIICPTHGEFSVWPNNFMRGHGCPACNGRERITAKVFIKRAKLKHNNRYDYSMVDYKGLSHPVSIICPVHGVFQQKPSYHLNGNGCQKCFGTPKSNLNEFIEKAKAVYGDLYDYSKVDYKGNKTKVCIICPEHGEWMVTPNNFLRGSRCPRCYGTPKYTTEEFIKMAKCVHGNKYDYSKVKYDGLKRKVIIICPKHGEFKQSPHSHISGHGCSVCSGRERITKDIFIERSIRNHKTRYDYSKVEFDNPKKRVCIICPEHGEFWQSALYHMHGGNCQKCVGGIRTTEDFIKKAKKIHAGKYDYSKVEYKNTSTKVCIICPDHGEFWQTPNNHLFGAGCPTCPQSNLEGEMRQFLLKNGIEFNQEYCFDWLRHKRKMALDFYLPQYKIAIECQGKQHFKPVNIFGGEAFYRKTIERDILKKLLCEEHGIRVIYFSNAHINYPYKVIETYAELLDEIKLPH